MSLLLPRLPSAGITNLRYHAWLLLSAFQGKITQGKGQSPVTTVLIKPAPLITCRDGKLSLLGEFCFIFILFKGVLNSEIK